jgi:putative peptidoglycan lipid II flippase
VRATLRRSLLFLAFLTLPATAGLLVLGRPIVRLLYERGRFGPDATEGTAAALAFYALGLVAYTSVKVLAPAFYALGTPRVPLLASGLAVLTNVAVNVALYERFGFRAVALGTALGAIANAAVLLVLFERRHGGVLRDGAAWRLAKMGMGSLAMAAALVPVRSWLETVAGTEGLRAQLTTGLLPVGVGVVLYGALALGLRLPEAVDLLDLARRRIDPRPS